MTSQAEQIEELLKCCVCWDQFKNPKLLPCQHSICLDPCLRGMSNGRKVRCPECRVEHRIPHNGIEGFPTNLTLNRFLDLSISNNSNSAQDVSPLPSAPPQQHSAYSQTPQINTRRVEYVSSQTTNTSRTINTQTPERLTGLIGFITSQPVQRNASVQTVSWIKAHRSVPAGALVGGRDKGGENLYVGRAQHQGSLTPGKVNASHGLCYVAWGGREHGKTEYEVLVGSGEWVRGRRANIHPNALPGGQTEDGEILFIGRVRHDGTVTIGKVQPSHNVCYISFAGKELPFADYEILLA